MTTRTLTVALASLLGTDDVAGREVKATPVWAADEHRRGQGRLIGGRTWLGSPRTATADDDGVALLRIESSALLGNARYTISVERGPTWTGVEMPNADAVFSIDMVEGPHDDLVPLVPAEPIPATAAQLAAVRRIAEEAGAAATGAANAVEAETAARASAVQAEAAARTAAVDGVQGELEVTNASLGRTAARASGNSEAVSDLGRDKQDALPALGVNQYWRTGDDRAVVAADVPSGGEGGGITADDSVIDGTERYLAAVLRGGNVIQYWDRSRQVPIAGRVGFVLTKTGENDNDYEFRAAEAAEIGDDTITPVMLLADEAAQQAAFRGRIAAASQATQTQLATAVQQAMRDVTTARSEARDAQTTADRAEGGTRLLRPVSAWERSQTARTLYFEWRPRIAVAAGAQIAVTVGGTQNNVRAAAASAAADTVLLTVPVAAGNAGTVTREAATVAGYVPVQVTHLGGLYDTWLRAVDPPPAAPKSRIVQAAVDVSGGGANLGVASIVLPADYATYRDLNLALFESQDDALADHDIRTTLLAAQRGQVEITVAGNPGVAAAASVTWNPQTRTITALSQRNAPVRIVYAELHD
ncbi:MAG: hypothetical protein OXF27_07560 [Acidobacteria bacterium]|nr:hypothetical protein [Acidobacteriota bacterium]